jgi:hypothetical protein
MELQTPGQFQNRALAGHHRSRIDIFVGSAIPIDGSVDLRLNAPPLEDIPQMARASQSAITSEPSSGAPTLHSRLCEVFPPAVT